MTMRGMNSKAVSPVPAVSCARLNSPSADLKSGIATMRGRLLQRARKQLEHGRRDDAERAFRADEQVSQVVAGVVLLQGLEAVPDAPVGQHHLEAEHQLARVAVGQHADAAGVGAEVAAELAAALRRQAQRETAGWPSRPPPAPRPASGRSPPSWCSPPHRPRARPSAGSPRAAVSPCIGICPPTRPVLPACGTTGMRCSCASARIFDTSSVEPGRSTTRGPALVHVAPLAQVGQLLVGVGERVAGSDDGAQAIEQFRREHASVWRGVFMARSRPSSGGR